MDYDKKLIKKLSRPIHIDYISEVFFKGDMDQTRNEINQMINDGIVEESKYGKDYFVLTNNND